MKYLAILLAICFGLANCSSKQELEKHDPSVYYTCSMDPQVMETKPGKCPICHMELTPIRLDQILANGLKLSDEQVRLAHIQTQKVEYGMVEHNVFATGTIKENQNNVQFVNARVEGRIDHLYIKTNGAAIQKGQVLYQIYSEMLSATQSEFIQNWKSLYKRPGEPLLKSIHETAQNKLALWGLTTSQIEQLKTLDTPTIPYPILSPVSGVVKSVRVSEGTTVMEGDPVLELIDYTSLWVEAEFYPKETEQIREGTKVDVYVSESGKGVISGKVIQILPQVVSSSTVNIVRVSISAKDEAIQPGMQVHVAWHREGDKSLVVPTSAVLREAKGNTVWVKNKEEVYEPKSVHLGKVNGAKTEILHGLKEGDEVVISGAYLLQSEYVFKKGNNPMVGHEM